MTDKQKHSIALRFDVVAKWLIAALLAVLSWNAKNAVGDLREVKGAVNELQTDHLIEVMDHKHLKDKVKVVEGKVDDHEGRLRDVEKRL